MIKILLIGAGHQSTKLYYPAIKDLINKGYSITLTGIVDVDSQVERIQSELSEYSFNLGEHKIVRVPNREAGKSLILRKSTVRSLNSFVHKNEVNAVIIATDPLSRKAYIKWALENKLHIFSEKPLTLQPWATVNSQNAKQILADYEEVVKLRDSVMKSNPDYKGIFFVNLPRRYQPMYDYIWNYTQKVYERTGCPITSITINECDGQWRFPEEYLISMTHAVNEGVGKLTFTGYHYLDFICELFNNLNMPSKSKVTRAQMYATAIRPSDSAKILSNEVTERVLSKSNYFDSKHLKSFEKFGEIDICITIKLCHGKDAICLINLMLQQSGNSYRCWFEKKDDPQIKAGRIKNKSILIHQGPFYSSQFHKYQLKVSSSSSNAFGHRHHHEIINVANPLVQDIFGKRITRKTFSLPYTKNKIKQYLLLPIEDFIKAILNQKVSDRAPTLDSVRGSIELLTYAYLSLSLEAEGKSPVIEFKLDI